jgi:integrase
MASLYKRDGIWYAKWYENGKRCRKSLGTKSVQRARAKVRDEIEKPLEEGRPVGTLKDISVSDFTPAFLAHVTATKRPHTVKTLAHEWKHLCAWAKPVKLGDVTPERIDQYKMHLLKEGYAKSTVRSTLLALSSVYKTAIKEMRVYQGENPVKGVELPKPDERFPRFLSADEYDYLLECAEAHSPDLHMLVALGVFAGLRKNEIIHARWEWVDFQRKRILVEGHGRFKTKSGKPRAVPLSSRLRAILEPRRPDKGRGYIIYPDFPDKDGTETTYRVDFTTAYATVAKAAGVPWCTPHKLRHTFASHLAQEGVSLYKIGTWLGHADPKTTMIYAHLLPADDEIDRGFPG